MTYYDEIAEGYNGLHKEEQMRKLRLILKHIKITSGMKVLDVGCGTGYCMDEIKCKCIGIDPSFELIKQAKKPVILGIGEMLPFRDKEFDLVICLTAIHNFRDYEKGIYEIRRVGKSFVISVLKKAKDHDRICRKLNDCLTLDDAHDTVCIKFKY